VSAFDNPFVRLYHRRPDEATVIGTIYDDPAERFVVALVVSYDTATAEEACAAALDLTRDAASEGTHWYVYDRRTGEARIVEQKEFVDIPVP